MQWTISLGLISLGDLSEIQGIRTYTTLLNCVILCLYFCSYYSLEAVSNDSINKFLSNIVEKIISDLSLSYCVQVDEVRRK